MHTQPFLQHLAAGEFSVPDAPSDWETKGSIRLLGSDGPLGEEVTHPNPPACIWATAASQRAPWAPAACGGKGLRPAAMSNWHPRSSEAGPGRSGRRQISAEDRAPEGEARHSHVDPRGWRRASPCTALPPPPLDPVNPLTISDRLATLTKWEGGLPVASKAQPLP